MVISIEKLMVIITSSKYPPSFSEELNIGAVATNAKHKHDVLVAVNQNNNASHFSEDKERSSVSWKFNYTSHAPVVAVDVRTPKSYRDLYGQ